MNFQFRAQRKYLRKFIQFLSGKDSSDVDSGDNNTSGTDTAKKSSFGNYLIFCDRQIHTSF